MRQFFPKRASIVAAPLRPKVYHFEIDNVSHAGDLLPGSYKAAIVGNYMICAVATDLCCHPLLIRTKNNYERIKVNLQKGLEPEKLQLGEEYITDYYYKPWKHQTHPAECPTE